MDPDISTTVTCLGQSKVPTTAISVSSSPMVNGDIKWNFCALLSFKAWVSVSNQKLCFTDTHIPLFLLPAEWGISSAG